jgi:hypothetical protein
LESRGLKKIFESMAEQATGSEKKLHKYELRDLYSPPNIGGVIKENGMF